MSDTSLDSTNTYTSLNLSDVVTQVLGIITLYDTQALMGDKYGYFYTESRNITTMSNADKLLLGVLIDLHNNESQLIDYMDNGQLISSVPQSLISQIVTKNLGFSVDLTSFGGEYSPGIFTYNASTATFDYQWYDSYASTGYTNYYETQVLSAKESDTSLIIRVQNVHVVYDTSTDSSLGISVYNDSNRTTLLYSDSFSYDDSDEFDNLDSIIQSLISSGSVYEFEFTKDGDNYYFYSSTLKDGE